MYHKAWPWVVRQFWDHIRSGMSAAEAGLVVGVSVHTGRAWFADAGGVRPKFPDEGPRRRPRLTQDERVDVEVGVQDAGVDPLHRGPAGAGAVDDPA